MSDSTRPRPADYFSDWKAREALAEDMIPLVGALYRKQNVKTYIYGRSLVAQSVLDIMKTHRFVRQVEHNELFEVIANGEYKFADAERGAQATMTAILGRMATYSGEVVEWDEALNSQLSLMPARYAFDATPPVVPNEHGRYAIPVPGETQAF